MSNYTSPFTIVHLPDWNSVVRLAELLGVRVDNFDAPFKLFGGDEGKFCVKVAGRSVFENHEYSFCTWGREEDYEYVRNHVTIDEFAAMCGEVPEEFCSDDFMEVLLNG